MLQLPMEMMVGQRLMVGFDGNGFNDDLATLIANLKVGGLILFSRNLGSPEQIRLLCRDCQDCAAHCGMPPLFIAIDQEGGQVARLKPPFSRFPGNSAMRRPADAVHFARVTATELNQVGINMNMAPVLDVVPEGVAGIMAGRAFGSDPHWVATLGMAVIDHLQQAGIMAVAKHFPGIGRTVLDSHRVLPELEIDAQALADFDLIPFTAAIRGKVAGVMLSHVRYSGIDPVWPASLSRAVSADLLRQKLGYDGVVMTDDLDMGAIKPAVAIETAIGRILRAEVDIALICHKGPDIEAAWRHIHKTLTGDAQLKAMGMRSLQRILELKKTYLNGPWESHYGV
jgi:beta-N-acetylhexosaminidase